MTLMKKSAEIKTPSYFFRQSTGLPSNRGPPPLSVGAPPSTAPPLSSGTPPPPSTDLSSSSGS